MPIKTGWRDASLAFCKIAKAFKHNTICDSNGIQTYNYLVRKRKINHFAKLTKWFICVVSTYLNFRYHVPWHLGNYRVYIHSEMRTWHDNDIQGLHILGIIKIVTTMIHYCYCLIAYGKWRPIIWYRMVNITFYFFCVKMFKAIGDSF